MGPLIMGVMSGKRATRVARVVVFVSHVFYVAGHWPTTWCAVLAPLSRVWLAVEWSATPWWCFWCSSGSVRACAA